MQNQPQPTVHTIHITEGNNNNSTFGDIALVTAGLLTFCTFFFGCWFATIFSVMALMLAVVVSQ